MKWSAFIPTDDASQLETLRLMEAVQACACGEGVWLRGDDLNDETDLALRKVSGARRFVQIDERQLVPQGARVPTHLLPEGPWVALTDIVRPTAPPAALAGQAPLPSGLRLVRSGRPREANVLLTGLDRWLAYAQEASQARLQPLCFAVSAEAQVIVRGSPLPPLPGQLLVEDSGIAAPCGTRWEPALDAAVLREAFGTGPGDLVIFRPSAACAIVRRGSFVAASRSAVRLTAREFGRDI